LLKPGAIFEDERVSANREGYLGASAGGLDGDRGARPIWIGWSAARLLDLKQPHARVS
jgi:hypothetical protein